MSKYIMPFSEIRMTDVSKVGGKNASLGEMYNALSGEGILVPNGFATTALAYQHFIASNQFEEFIEQQLSVLDRTNFSNLKEVGLKIRTKIQSGSFPEVLEFEIKDQYRKLLQGQQKSVAVRSSATAEDLPNASFAGQHESYLNIIGEAQVLEAIRNCYASMYTDRAIKYREDKGFAHERISLSAGVQQMVRADLGCSGVGFTLEPESGFRDVVHIAGVWGLGENIVQGTVNPDEWLVFKPSLAHGMKSIIQRKKGDKAFTMQFTGDNAATATVNIPTPLSKQEAFVLTNEEVEQIANWGMILEDHYRKPMDFEWAKDGLDHKIYLVQARPETVQSQRTNLNIHEFSIKETKEPLCTGAAIGSKMITGIARLFSGPEDGIGLKEGEIVVTDLTSPDWDPILKKAAAIITNKGGRTSHASIVARELGVPAVVGTNTATNVIKDGDQITVSCAEGKIGKVYAGAIKWEEKITELQSIDMPEFTAPMMIVGDPDKAFSLSFLPNAGVGLMRMEFIITHHVKVHPMALVNFEKLTDNSVKSQISSLTKDYATVTDYFIDTLSQGIATIAAAFFPKDVIIRMSDFKTNEYASLLGGKEFEPLEENPMIGFRGASRYYHPSYKEGFKLECEAVKKVRNEMGLTNVKVMIPFCRTVEEGQKVLDVMNEFGLKQGKNGLEVYMMAEIPSNVIQAEDFAELFDGFSIGSNDLTQLTLGIDRDSAMVAGLFDERNKAAQTMISLMIQRAKRCNKKIGLCGQAPSDYPEFAQFLVSQGIDSISFNSDALIKGIENIHLAEQKLQSMGV